MPGLAGLISANRDLPRQGLEVLLESLQYGRAVAIESYVDDFIGLGCVHLGTGGQRNLYQSTQIVVIFYGYLTEPSFPPGPIATESNAAAHYIHDLYLEKGETMLSHLAGAFALALWDKRTQTLLLASDRLGLRNIYYAEQNGCFRFASEVKGILADPAFPRPFNPAAIADFFYFSYVTGNKTFFEEIQLLPPASLLRYHECRLTVSSYWDISYPENYPYHPDQWYADLIYNSLKDAVQRLGNSGVRFGLSLSGGMDSRWIAAFLAKVQPQSKTFTVGIPGSDDTYPAQEVATRTGLSNCYWDISANFVSELSESYSYIVDGMYDLFSIEEFPLTVKVGDYVDVSVGGLLGDCLFGHEINPVSALLHKHDIKTYWLWRNRGTWLNPSLGDKVFGKKRRQEFENMAMTSLHECIASAPSEHGFQTLQYINLRNRQRRYINIAQQAKLTYVDIYHPIADSDVVQAALQLPPKQLMMERAYRRSMAYYFPGLAAIPWTFTLTPPTISVPAVILKKATQLTLGRWLRETPFGNHPLIRPRRYYTNYSQWSRGPLRTFIEKTLFSPEANATGLFDYDGLKTVIYDHMDGKQDVTGFIGQALAIALWSRLFYAPSTPSRPSCFRKTSSLEL